MRGFVTKWGNRMMEAFKELSGTVKVDELDDGNHPKPYGRRQGQQDSHKGEKEGEHKASHEGQEHPDIPFPQPLPLLGKAGTHRFCQCGVAGIFKVFPDQGHNSSRQQKEKCPASFCPGGQE